MSPSDRVVEINLQVPGSVVVAFYKSQGCDRSVLTLLYTGMTVHYSVYIKVPL
jgi:hypothetical protein